MKSYFSTLMDFSNDNPIIFFSSITKTLLKVAFKTLGYSDSALHLPIPAVHNKPNK